MFNAVTTELKEWLKPQLNNGEIDEAEKKKRVKALFKVLDHQDMYRLIMFLIQLKKIIIISVCAA